MINLFSAPAGTHLVHEHEKFSKLPMAGLMRAVQEELAMQDNKIFFSYTHRRPSKTPEIAGISFNGVGGVFARVGKDGVTEILPVDEAPLAAGWEEVQVAPTAYTPLLVIDTFRHIFLHAMLRAANSVFIELSGGQENRVNAPELREACMAKWETMFSFMPSEAFPQNPDFGRFGDKFSDEWLKDYCMAPCAKKQGLPVLKKRDLTREDTDVRSVI